MTSKREQFYKRRIAELEAQLKQRDQRIAIAKSGYGMPGKYYIGSFFIKLVVLLTNQKDYGHYLARASGHYNLRKSPQFYISIFDFFRNTRYASRFTIHDSLFTN